MLRGGGLSIGSAPRFLARACQLGHRPVVAPTDPPATSLRRSVVRVGQPRAYLTDLYAGLLALPWRYLIALLATAYVLVNAAYASLYVGLGDCVGGGDGGFFDAFFFSIQTLATIGYGVMHPAGTCGHVLVGLESLNGLLGFAVVSGIVFAKFARPSAAVIWSSRAVIARRNGVPHLMFRVANARGSHVAQASLQVVALLDDVTAEGERMRRMHDLALERAQTPLLIMSWLVLHRIDETSPLYGKSAEDFARGDIRITASLTGIDDVLAQAIYAYHQYGPDQVVRDARFVDVIRRLPDGRSELNLGKFHDVERSPS